MITAGIGRTAPYNIVGTVFMNCKIEGNMPDRGYLSGGTRSGSRRTCEDMTLNHDTQGRRGAPVIPGRPAPYVRNREKRRRMHSRGFDSAKNGAYGKQVDKIV